MGNKGHKQKIYTYWATVLKNIFLKNIRVLNIKIINSEYNILYIITSLKKDEPSTRQHISYSNSSCKNYLKIMLRSSIQPTNSFKSLKNNLTNYTYINKYNCANCKRTIILLRHF